MVRRTKEEAEQTRAMLLDAAEAVFLQNGVAGASLDQIARAAGVTRGAVYWHFKNKDDIFHAMHERVKLPIKALFEEALAAEDPVLALKDFCIHILRYLARDERARRVFTIMQFKCETIDPGDEDKPPFDQNRDEMIKKTRKVFRKAQDDGIVTTDLSADAMAIALHNYMSGIFADYLRNPGLYNMRTIAPKLVEIFFRGIAA